MLMDIFASRNDTVASLLKLSECLGRSLRENVALFLVDGEDNRASFITESDSVITGNYTVTEDSVGLDNIEIEDSSSYKSGEAYDTLVSDKIHSFVGDLSKNSIQEANSNFEDVLKLWGNRLRFDNIKQSLDEKALRFDETVNIVQTPEFSRLMEITPSLVKYLSENFDSVVNIPEIFNACRLSNSLAEAFNIPRLTSRQLSEAGSYSMKSDISNSVFDMICRQELVKKELLESKKDFDVIWATNDKVKKLAGLIFENDEAVSKVLAEAIEEVPYLALVSKSTLNSTIKNSLNFDDKVGISESDIRSHASRIFELKKPVRVELINLLNENYGINIQNLKEPASFKSLLNTQVVIFETLSRISPKGSVQRKTLSEMSEMLKYKSGVESVDINDYLFSVLQESGFVEHIEEKTSTAKKPNDYMGQSVNFKKVGKDLKQIGDVFGMIKQNMQYSSDENLDKTTKERQGANAKTMEKSQSEEGGVPAQTEMDSQMERPPVPEPEQHPDEMVQNMSQLEGLIDDLASQLGMKTDEKPEEAPEEDSPEVDDKEKQGE